MENCPGKVIAHRVPVWDCSERENCLAPWQPEAHRQRNINDCWVVVGDDGCPVCDC
jgi:hypothetical protein